MKAIIGLLFVASTLPVGLTGEPQIKGLSADRPSPAYADKMMLFGQFIGDWQFDMVLIRPDGTRVKGDGEWHFGWALDGRAVQDVWIARDDLSQPDAPITEWGTTIRVYDPKRNGWRVVWMGPMRGNVVTFTATKIGDEIVMEADSRGGSPERGRWIISKVTPTSFYWRAVRSVDNGQTWELTQEMFVRRADQDARSPVAHIK
jgi:hypothetical protein